MRIFDVTLIALSIGLGAERTASAQATVPAKGEGTVSVTFQNYRHTGHFDRNGDKNDNGATQSQVFITQLDFGVTDTFALSVTLPFIASKYTGPDVYFVEGIETRPGPLDVDRTYHGAFQDLRIEVRRMFLPRAVALAPYISVSIPTHSYETKGEAVPGRHRTELQLGLYAGADLDSILRDTQVQARYSWATLEKASGFAHTRSNIDLEISHVLAGRIDVHGALSWQIAHKRPTVPQMVPFWDVHDRLVNANYLSLSGGASFALNGSTDIYVSAAGTLSGRRGAHVARVVAIGVSRGFGAQAFEGIGR